MSLVTPHEMAMEFAERLREIGPILVTRFFGGAGLVRNDVQFAFVIRGVFYLRVDDQSRPDFEKLGSTPFTYAGRSKEVIVASYYKLPDVIAGDHDELIRWATRASHAAIVAKSSRRRRKQSSR